MKEGRKEGRKGGEKKKKRKKKEKENINSGVLGKEGTPSLPQYSTNQSPAPPPMATMSTGHLSVNTVAGEWSAGLGVQDWGSEKNDLSPYSTPGN